MVLSIISLQVIPRAGASRALSRIVIDCPAMRNLPSSRLLLFGICLWALSVNCRAQVLPGAEMDSVLLVANQRDQNLSIIDPVAVRQIAVVAEGGVTGHEVATSPDGRTAYVPIYGDSGVGKPGSDGRNMVVIDIPSRKVVGNVDFGHGVRPHCVVYDPNSSLLYVTTELDQTVTVVDPHTLKVVGSIPTTQAESHMLAISHDGRRGYTSNVGPGTVSVLDMTARKTIAVIPISATAQRISISNDGRMVFTSDQTKPQLAVIDTSTNKLKTWVPLPASGYGTAPTTDGRWLLVAVPSIGKVAVVDLGTLKVVRAIDVPRGPAEILMRPDGLVAYVSCPPSHQVAVIDLGQWKVQALIDAGTYADGLAWAGKPSTQSPTGKH
jgi:DNA-binding beta-propeller fold protein YncE